MKTTLLLLLFPFLLTAQMEKDKIIFDHMGWSVMQSYKIDNQGNAVSDTTYTLWTQEGQYQRLYRPFCMYTCKSKAELKRFITFLYKAFNEVPEHCTKKYDLYKLSVQGIVVNKTKIICITSHDNDDKFTYMDKKMWSKLNKEI